MTAQLALVTNVEAAEKRRMRDLSPSISFREYDFTPSRSAVIFFGLLGRNPT